MTEHDTLAGAYVAALASVLDDGESVLPVTDELSIGSSFGARQRATLELRPFGFRVRDPRACLLRCSRRQPDLGFSIGQWLWVMGGQDDLAQIAFYNSDGRLFSDDGRTLHGAFGARMRNRSGDQLLSVLARLRRDPGTRRALIVFAQPSDSWTSTRDHPCAISLQFLIRGGRLEAITTMRSQSALMVLPYDGALFMTIQIWVAACLGVQPGVHTWLAHSFHIYEDEVDLAHAVLGGPVDARSLPPVSDPEAGLPGLLRFEQDLRLATQRSAHSEVAALTGQVQRADELHQAARAILLAHAARRLKDVDLWRETLDRLPEDWRDCLRQPDEFALPDIPGLHA